MYVNTTQMIWANDVRHSAKSDRGIYNPTLSKNICARSEGKTCLFSSDINHAVGGNVVICLK